MTKRRGNPDKLKPFQKGDPRINREGRPRKWVTTLKHEGYKRDEIDRCIKLMLAMTDKEIDEVVKSKEATKLEKIIASILKRSQSYGDAWKLEQLITRAFGSPTQNIDFNGDMTHVITGMEIISTPPGKNESKV